MSMLRRSVAWWLASVTRTVYNPGGTLIRRVDVRLAVSPVGASEAIRPTLLAVKNGEVAMPDVMQLARTLTPQLEAARATSPLPKHADVARADRALRAVREEAARRAIAAAPGPWGRDAPAPAEASYDD